MPGLMMREREADFAARWAAGAWRGQTLSAETGERFTVVYQGRRGGSAGPDFRDAVLTGPEGAPLCGDVELHLRAAGWHAHGHAEDPRYNGLVLHVTLGAAPGARATRLASGREVPLVVLHPLQDTPPAPVSPWPCAGLAARLSPAEMRELLAMAGLARFRLRAEILQRESRAAASLPPSDAAPAWDLSARVLFVNLAEALAYGRDRAALRAAGERLAYSGELAHGSTALSSLPSVERQRLEGLLRLYARYQAMGPWAPLRAALLAEAPSTAGRALIHALRVPGGAVSPGRAAIMVANVVLPFAAAAGAAVGEPALVARAEAVYAALPGLPSNAITRLLARQLGLARLPRGAIAQLGLHHLWAVACREKRCERCPCVMGLAEAPPT